MVRIIEADSVYGTTIIRLTEGHDDQLVFFTTSYEDEMTMMNFLEQMAA